MRCAQNEMLSGFRARVIRFTMFDYAADIEIQCSQISGSDGPNGPFRVSPNRPTWHHPEAGLRIGNLPLNFVATEITDRAYPTEAQPPFQRRSPTSCLRGSMSRRRYLFTAPRPHRHPNPIRSARKASS
jgi:hypothetical protein